MKKLLSILFLATVLTVSAQADVVTYIVPNTGVASDKYLTIPAGKICKILTYVGGTTSCFIDVVDDQNNDLHRLFTGQADINTKTDPVVVAGPIKLQIHTDSGAGSNLLTVEITDQTTPASNLPLTDS